MPNLSKIPGKKRLAFLARTLSLSEGTCLVFVPNSITLITLPDIKENLETINGIVIKRSSPYMTMRKILNTPSYR
jgi:hypothetical protein